jgi:hypothetical protein
LNKSNLSTIDTYNRLDKSLGKTLVKNATVTNLKSNNKPLLTDPGVVRDLKKNASNKTLIKKNINQLNITNEIDSNRKQTEPKTPQMKRNMTTNNLLKPQTKTPAKTSDKELEILKKNPTNKKLNIKSSL